MAIMLVPAVSFALPALQLGGSGATYYDPVTETVVIPGSSFSLYALLDPTSFPNKLTLSEILNDTYYVSIALTPKEDIPGNYGSFSLAGDDITGFNDIATITIPSISVTDDMIYGNPPLEVLNPLVDPHDLAKHGIFPTYYAEVGFQFNPLNKADAYNVQDNPSGFVANPGGELYYSEFSIDISSLSTEHNLHFDLYNTAVAKKGDDVDVYIFAPFSKDAVTRRVPEPATMLFFIGGLIFLGGLKKKFNE